jgi:tetratricopeptide (TPR) repeat protein
MAKKRKLKKKEIKEDRLITLALQTSNYVQEHFTQVISGVVVLIAVIAVVLFTANARRNTAMASERELSLALTQYQMGDKELAGTAFANLADRYSSHQAGVMAMYFLGECHLATYRYDEAITAYDRYLDKAGSEGAFRDAALIGKAMGYEGLLDFKEAARIMEQVVEGLDENDPRYLETLFRAATFYRETEDYTRAKELYKRVRDGATGGPLKDRATVWLNVLQ